MSKIRTESGSGLLQSAMDVLDLNTNTAITPTSSIKGKSKGLSISKATKTAKSSGPKITATSQSSRFHVDTLTTLSHEIDLHQVNISVGLNDLLVDAHLRLKGGVHYALVGRNGGGKSTLLTAIADRIIPGIPDNLRILLVSQIDDTSIDSNTTLLSGEETVNTPDLPELTVTQRVVKSDKRRERAIAEQQLLLKAHESTTSTNAIAHSIFSIRLSRAQLDLEEAKKIALRRSGARGAEARKALLRAEALVADLEKRIETEDWGMEEAKLPLVANEMLTDVQGTLDALDANTTEARARTILLGLGFTTAQLDAKFTTLSGGWRSRCSLANALLQQPDLLLLDEPTNYLDITSVIYLQNYLSSLPSAVLAVAHDREFIDAIAQEAITLRNKTLTYFDGNLSESERHAAKERKGKVRMKEAMDKKRGAIEKSIELGKATAKKSGDENRQRMVKSRQRKLDERWGLEKSDKGTRFKLNRDLSGYHLTNRAEVQIEDLEKPIKLVFPDPEPLRFPGALISASNITFSYPGSKTKVLEDVSLTVHPGDRVALVGKNGEGKSTLVKLLVGHLELPKGKAYGSIERHSRLRVGYFDQLSVEALSTSPHPAQASKSDNLFDFTSVSALEYFVKKGKELFSVDLEEHEARGFLGSFGLRGKTVINPINTLSGGQKVRLALALVVYPAPDLLVLDEATTHLDKDTIIAFVRALRRYAGAVLLVSHDRHFVRCVVEGAPILPPSEDGDDEEDEDSSDEDEDDQAKKKGTVYSVGPKGKVKPLAGGVDDYVALLERRMRKAGLL